MSKCRFCGGATALRGFECKECRDTRVRAAYVDMAMTDMMLADDDERDVEELCRHLRGATSVGIRIAHLLLIP